MSKQFKIFVINLKHKTELKNEMLAKLSYFNIEYEIIEAIYGKDLNNKYFIDNNIKIDPHFRNPYTYSGITMGEIGCSLSHALAWQKAVEQEIEFPIIIEDDAVINKDFEELLSDIVKINHEFDLLYFGRKSFINDKGDITKLNSKYKLVNPAFSYWTVGYMLTKKSAMKLVNSQFKQNLIAVDEFLPLLYNKHSSPYYNLNNYDIDNFVACAVEPKPIKPKQNAFLFSETEAQPFYPIKYKDNFYNNEIQMVTVGTDPVDGYKRFCESALVYAFPFICLGFGQPWGGNDMIKGPGGGHKVVLFKEYLDKFSDDDERILVFSDCYDAVISCSPSQILSKFREIQKNTGCDVLFSSEALIWPDSSLEPRFPNQSTPYKYLNSGGFMGSIKSLKLLTKTAIKSSDDDQLYYQLEYLKSVEGNHELKIILDAKAQIFQTLSTHFWYINIDYSKSKVKNDLTHSNPLIIHGNGGPESKMFLNKLCNYINLKYRTIYGYKDFHSDKNKLENINYHKYPRIYVMITVSNMDNISNINNLLEQRYPFSQINFNVLNLTNNDIGKYVDMVKLKYDINVNLYTCQSDSQSLKEYYIHLIDNILPKYDYWFIGNTKHKITEKHMFKKLICSNLPIVSPMLTGKNNTNFSNFWGEVNNEGFYSRSFDYFNILKREYKGYWNIPYINSSIMIHSSKFKNLKESMNKEKIRNNETNEFDMFFCRSIRTRYNFMYIVNFDDYGIILD